MQTTVEPLEGHTVRLTVTVTANEVDLAISAAYTGVSQKVRVPGFRKGKAPRQVIDTHVGRDEVMAEALESLVTETYSEAVKVESLRPIDRPDMGELDALVPGKDYEYSAEVAVRPEFELESAEGMSVTVPPREVTEEDIEFQLEQVRDRFATLEPVVDRGIEAGDFALITFAGTIEGETYEGNTVDSYLYELGRGVMPADFDRGLIGAGAGDEVRIAFPVPETSSNPDFVGKEAAFDVTIHEVKSKVLPTLDDEFAATAGGFDTLGELREDIEKKIASAKETTYHQNVERAARQVLAERVSGDVPEVMVDTRHTAMMRDFMNGLESRGMTLKQYMEAARVSLERIETDIREQAHRSVVEELALEALFRHLGMEITDADIDVEVAEMSAPDSDLAEQRAKWEELGLAEALREQATLRKASLWLLDHVEVVESDAEALASTEEECEVSSKEDSQTSPDGAKSEE